ncbi:MAG: ArgE/DapE family deacylase [Kiritimatiellia bacterium]
MNNSTIPATEQVGAGGRVDVRLYTLIDNSDRMCSKSPSMHEQDLIELLSSLIAVPSVNPAHCSDPDITGERRMADVIEHLFTERGLVIERLDPTGEDRPAVIGRCNTSDPRRTLMVEMHLDTVGVADMTVPPFQATIRDGKLYGRGSCDMKGSMAAFLHALTPERVEACRKQGVELMVVAAPDEETGTHGASHLVQLGIKADMAIILEPTRCLPVIAHKGAFWYDVELRGRSGHGSQPASGVSTNAALARFLPELLNIHQRLAETSPHPLLGASTLNLGRIEGGQTYNIIPERTRLHLDRRVVPSENAEAFVEEIQQLLEDLTQQGLLCGGSITLNQNTLPFATSPDAPLVTQLQAAITQVTGSPAPAQGTSWVSDASPFGQVCGQTLVFGPGDIAQAHTDNEYITLEQLRLGSRIFAVFLDHHLYPPV